MKPSAVIYWFSGTGNAWRLANDACLEIARLPPSSFPDASGEIVCDCRPVERLPPGGADREADWTGIVSPVLGFGLPRNVVSFLKRLPAGNGRKAFVVIAMGNTETIALGSRRWSVPPTEGIAIRQALRLLKRRGYDVVRAEALEMPTNWILAVNPPPPPAAAAITARGSEMMRSFPEALVRGERFLRRVGLLLAIPLALVYGLFSLIGRRYAGKWFYADDACDGCGTCAAQCPNGTIGMRGGRPVWGWNCLQCFRCINLCPRGAIQVSGLAIAATFAPVLLAGWCHRRSLGLILPHAASWAGWIACYFVVSATVVAVLHRLQCSRRAGRFVPRWPLTKDRARYREPGFAPPERNTIP